MLTVPIPLLVIAATALAPLGVGQQARLAAWLSWAVAYRECYKPAPLSLRIDEKLTAHCIENILRGKRSVPPEERAAIDALIATTPYLIGLLNTPAGATSRGEAAGSDPAAPPAHP
jgi:hypothetical protein